MDYIKKWWISIDRINLILILSLGITGLILSFSIDKYFSINRHSIFFIVSILLLCFLASLNNKNIRRVSLFFYFLIIYYGTNIFFRL